MPRKSGSKKRLPYAVELTGNVSPAKLESPLKNLFPSIGITSRLNPKAKSFKDPRKLDIRNTALTSNLNPLAKKFIPKSASGKKRTKNNRKKKRTIKKKNYKKKSRKMR